MRGNRPTRGKGKSRAGVQDNATNEKEGEQVIGARTEKDDGIDER